MDHTAIKHIQDTAAAVALSKNSLDTASRFTPLAALPENFAIHSLERYLYGRARYRAALETKHIASFAAYHQEHGEHAPVFINPDAMSALAIFNLGDIESPGHGDDTASLRLEKTAPFKAYLAITQNGPHSQKAIAEWVEDWRDHISAVGTDDTAIPVVTLAATLRNIDIEAARNVNSTAGDFSASRSAMESIEAKSTVGKLPKVVIFRCSPYHGLPEQDFRFRVTINTGDDKVKFSAQRIQEEADTEATAEMFTHVIATALADDTTILQGTFKLGN